MVLPSTSPSFRRQEDVAEAENAKRKMSDVGSPGSAILRPKIVRIAELAPKGAAGVDLPERFTWVNADGARLLERSAPDLCGLPAPSQTAPESSTVRVLLGGEDDHTIRWAPSGGRLRELSSRTSPTHETDSSWRSGT